MLLPQRHHRLRGCLACPLRRRARAARALHGRPLALFALLPGLAAAEVGPPVPDTVIQVAIGAGVGLILCGVVFILREVLFFLFNLLLIVLGAALLIVAVFGHELGLWALVREDTPAAVPPARISPAAGPTDRPPAR